MTRRRIVVVGTLASNPYAGMAWMHMQITAGLRRLGHDAYYFETTSAWPYDPLRNRAVDDSDYALPYLKKIAESFDLGDRWAYRRSYSDKAWFGLSRTKAQDLLAHADAVLNVAGATRFAEERLKIGRLVYFGTDPGHHEIAFSKGDENVRTLIAEHDDYVTYGENIGSADCAIPPLPNLRSKTRQPVLLDLWQNGRPSKQEFTTVANWRQAGRDIDFNAETYHWSKHHEFLKFIDLPRKIDQSIELATGLANLGVDDRDLLEGKGWRLVDAHPFTTDPWSYRDYVRSSRGEFTVAKDLNVRLHSGWFSERSACYLAAGRPVVTQDTGFGSVLPTGEGLFAFNTTEEILSAFEAIHSDYARHSRAAAAIAQEFFRAERVLKKVVGDLGL
ncbi:MAG: glycosyltransferase [Candidatus Binatia bacterium]